MKKFIMRCLLLIIHFFVVSNAVSLCCLPPTFDNDDSPTNSCDTEAPCFHDISSYNSDRNEIIGWDWDELGQQSISCREKCAFVTFNQKMKKPHWWHMLLNEKLSYNPHYTAQFIQQASIEELKHENQVIVYHGENLGIWLLQVLAKQLKYPHAKEWLPLRFDPDLADVDATTLKGVMKSLMKPLWKGLALFKDHAREFTAIGLSAHVNLMSDDPSESATLVFRSSSGFTGYSQQSNDEKLKYLDISTTLRAAVRERLTAMMYMVAWKMKWSAFEYANSDFESYFPSLNSNEIELIQTWRQTYNEIPLEKGVGIILQIVMPPELAEKYSYAAGLGGVIKRQPFLKYYKKHKNKLDRDGQLRIAMGHPFTRYPSPVKIKALSPIFQDEQHLVHKMMKDTVDFIREESQ